MNDEIQKLSDVFKWGGVTILCIFTFIIIVIFIRYASYRISIIKSKKLRERCTVKTKGIITKYYRYVEEIEFEYITLVYEYCVNNEKILGMSTSGKPHNHLKFHRNPRRPGYNLRERQNLKEKFKEYIGKSVTIYYNPNEIQEFYVEEIESPIAEEEFFCEDAKKYFSMALFLLVIGLIIMFLFYILPILIL